MASEQTYIDRLGRGVTLNETVKTFNPVFSPFDISIKPDNQAIFLADLEAKNNSVALLKSNYTTSVVERIRIVKDVKLRTSMIRNFIESVTTYKGFWKPVRDIVKRILNYKPPKPKSDVPKNDEEEKKRNRGEQSYSEMAGIFKSLISLLGEVPGYEPPNDSLKIPALTDLHTLLYNLNTEMGSKSGILSVAIEERHKLFDGTGGLKDRMKAVKNAVRSQYGNNSNEYLSVKGIKV